MDCTEGNIQCMLSGLNTLYDRGETRRSAYNVRLTFWLVVPWHVPASVECYTNLAALAWLKLLAVQVNGVGM